MKITFVLPYAGLAGGVRVVAIYAELLQARGHEVMIVSPARYRWPSRRKRAWHMVRRVVRRAAGRVDPSHLRDVSVTQRRIAHQPPIVDADVPDADVVVATWWETAEWVAALSPSKGAKAYFIQHYETHAGQPIQRVRNTWMLPLGKIVVASWLADIAANEFGDRNVSIVPNAVDASHFTTDPRGKQPRPTVGLMYSTKHYKGCDICLEAFDIARRRVGKLDLVAFGVREEPAVLPLPNGAKFTAQPDQAILPGLYASCDAWLFGSRSEGFGLPILEAMACRTPVIATPAGAAPDLLAAGGGLLVRPEDPRDMAGAIERIVNLSDGDWRALSEQARRIASGYTWNDAADRFEAALEHAIRSGRTGAPGASAA